MKYQTRVEYIDAIQFSRNNFDEVVSFTKGKVTEMIIEKKTGILCICLLETTDKTVAVLENDYIVKNFHHFYPRHREEFENKYVRHYTQNYKCKQNVTENDKT